MKNRITVLHILEAVAGGTRKVVELQLRFLDSSEFDVSICIPPVAAIENTRKGELNDPQFSESLKKSGFVVYEIAMLSEQLFSYTNIAAIYKLTSCVKSKGLKLHTAAARSRDFLVEFPLSLQRFQSLFILSRFFFFSKTFEIQILSLLEF